MEKLNHSWIGFDPTDNNHIVNTKRCNSCGGRSFESYKEGDFRSVTYIEICKDCRTVYHTNPIKK